MANAGIQDLGEWLQGLGLGRYEATFRAHAIDADVLPELTEADLKRLGVALGSRKRMMKAITEIEAGGASIAPVQVSAVERRPITVLSCRFEASSLPAQFDAEDWRDLYGGCVSEALAIVARFGGRGYPDLGDGLMAMFGYPLAQENDAERAVRAALAIRLAVEKLNARSASATPQRSVRIGLASGKVVVDSMGGVFGKATSIAARAQAAADRGTVVITTDVLRQVAGLFIVENLGPHDLKGVPHKVNLHRIRRASSGRRSGVVARALTPFIGRRAELDLLARQWKRAQSGAGQLALITGAPGMGKSRLLYEFHAMLSEVPHTWIQYNGSPLLQSSRFYPTVEWGRHRFDASAPPADRLAELERTLTHLGLDAETIAPIVAPLVDIPLPPDRVPRMDPDELFRRQVAAGESWVLAGARAQPAVVAFDDVQWCDPASFAFLAALAESGAQAPLLILLAARPEFRTPWPSRMHHTTLELAPFDSAEVGLMVRALAAPHEPSKDDIGVVIERCDGVPLFVEEVGRLLLERGKEAGVRAIPRALQQRLAARLDRLGGARGIAELGAVLGRTFDYALLRGLAGLPEAALRNSLERLTEADILDVNGVPPDRDAAYGSLLMSRRQALHLRAAELLRDPKRATFDAEAVARHVAAADNAGHELDEDAEDRTN